jgi:hypothetical protein
MHDRPRGPHREARAAHRGGVREGAEGVPGSLARTLREISYEQIKLLTSAAATTKTWTIFAMGEKKEASPPANVRCSSDPLRPRSRRLRRSKSQAAPAASAPAGGEEDSRLRSRPYRRSCGSEGRCGRADHPGEDAAPAAAAEPRRWPRPLRRPPQRACRWTAAFMARFSKPEDGVTPGREPPRSFTAPGVLVSHAMTDTTEEPRSSTAPSVSPAASPRRSTWASGPARRPGSRKWPRSPPEGAGAAGYLQPLRPGPGRLANTIELEYQFAVREAEKIRAEVLLDRVPKILAEKGLATAKNPMGSEDLRDAVLAQDTELR